MGRVLALELEIASKVGWKGRLLLSMLAVTARGHGAAVGSASEDAPEKPADATRSVLKRFEFRAADAPMYQARFLHRRLDGGGFDFHHYREYHTVRMHGSRSKRPPDCAVLTGRIDVLGVVSSVTEDYFVKRLVPGGVPEPSSASGPPDKWELVQVAPYFCSDASQFVIEVVEITSFTEAVPL